MIGVVTPASANWPRLGAIALGGLASLVVVAGLGAVIAAGFALSFDAVGSVGRASGMRPDLSWLLPAAVDGAMAVATVTVVVVRRLGRSTAYGWTVMLVNAAVSVACNGLHAYAGISMHLPSEVAVAVSAVPAVNLALSTHLLVMLVDALVDVVGQSASPAVKCVVGEETRRREGRAVVSQTVHARSVDAVMQHTPVADEPRPHGLAGGPDSSGRQDGAVSRRGARELQRAAWQWAQRNRRSDGSHPSGAEIGRVHLRSPRWGRMVRRAGINGELDAATPNP